MDWLIRWLTFWLIDWLIDLLIDCLIECLFDWFIGLYIYVISELIDWLIDWMIDWLIGWLIDWLIDWLMDWLFFLIVRCLICMKWEELPLKNNIIGHNKIQTDTSLCILVYIIRWSTSTYRCLYSLYKQEIDMYIYIYTYVWSIWVKPIQTNLHISRTCVYIHIWLFADYTNKWSTHKYVNKTRNNWTSIFLYMYDSIYIYIYIYICIYLFVWILGPRAQGGAPIPSEYILTHTPNI